MQNILKSHATARVFYELYKKHSCMRCILRFFQVQEQDLYRQSDLQVGLVENVSRILGLNDNLLRKYDKEYHILNDESNHGEDCKQRKCILCLGILQTVDHKATIERITQRILDDNHEFKDFKYTIKIPYSCSIRYTQMAYYLKQRINQYPKLNEINSACDYLVHREAIDIKTAYKWLLSPYLSEKFKCVYDPNSKFTINIRYDNQKLENEEVYMDIPIFIVTFHQFSKYSTILKHIHKSEFAHKVAKARKSRLLNPNSSIPKNPLQTEPTKGNLERICSLDESTFMSMKLQEETGLYKPPELASRDAGDKVTGDKTACEPDDNDTSLSVNCIHEPIHLMGRYLKFSREFSQTAWDNDGKYKSASSIEEELAKVVLPYFKSKECLFHSGGREDIDVRMLGQGRPFSLQIIDPKRISSSLTKEDYQQMEDRINKIWEMRVHGLHLGDDTVYEKLKHSESEKIKAYSCVVYSKRRLNPTDKDTLESLTNLTINQRTPIRVAHRRGMMIRQKVIHKLKINMINEHFMILNMLASAGTYIKEFIHGDLERTLPNLGTLLATQCDILQLDVIDLYDKYDSTVVHDFMKV